MCLCKQNGSGKPLFIQRLAHVTMNNQQGEKSDASKGLEM